MLERLLLLMLLALDALVPAVRVTPASLLVLTTLLVPLLRATPKLLGPGTRIPAGVGHCYRVSQPDVGHHQNEGFTDLDRQGAAANGHTPAGYVARSGSCHT